MAKPDFPYVYHAQFGNGIVFGDRSIDVGVIRDVWFPDSKQTRAILPEYLGEAAKPDFGPGALRSAFSSYRKMFRVKRATEPEAEPEPKTRDLDEDSWRVTPPEFEGDEEALAIAAD